MKRVIHKYPLDTGAKTQAVMVPTDSRVLHIGVQGGRPMAWLDRPCEAKTMTEWKVVCLGTGREYESRDMGLHRGTVQIGDFVWHFYDEA